MRHIVVLSGAGMSAESGISTFRDNGGLWDQYDISEVATPEAWARQPELVLEFYNMRRSALAKAEPNSAHLALTRLEEHFDVSIITQNVDDLHERAGSKNILHLHGELTKVRSTKNEFYIQDIGYQNIRIGDQCPDGGQLRPHIVWFGEEVPKLTEAAQIIRKADILLIIGTSMQVYPASQLIYEAVAHCEVYYVDPDPAPVYGIPHLKVIKEKAGIGVPALVQNFISKNQ